MCPVGATHDEKSTAMVSDAYRHLHANVDQRCARRGDNNQAHEPLATYNGGDDDQQPKTSSNRAVHGDSLAPTIPPTARRVILGFELFTDGRRGARPHIYRRLNISAH